LGYGDNKVKDWYNKQRVLMCLSRGIGSRYRHLMSDLMAFLAHVKKENKIEKNEIADQIRSLVNSNSCNNLMFFEQRKNNTYLWMGKSPEGPSCNFKIENGN
jgi:ribosome biogenesis protein BRX1